MQGRGGAGADAPVHAAPDAGPAPAAGDPPKNAGAAVNPGIWAALAAFSFWGLVPIFFKWLTAVPAMEIVAHRVVWAVPFLLVFLLVRDGRALPRRLRVPPRTLAVLAFSGSLVVFNWLVFVWAVINDQVMATSLGYFITPLVNVLLGFVVLRERLAAPQWLAVALAAAGTVYLGWFLGAAPWVSLLLAFSFGFYGLLRKRLDVGPMVGLTWESGILAVPALGFMAWQATHGGLVFASGAPRLDALLVLSGLVTVLPLIWFNVAAKRLRLSTIGFLQYIGPTISFLLAVFAFGEVFTQGHAVAFSAIWLGLAVFTFDSLRRSRRRRA